MGWGPWAGSANFSCGTLRTEDPLTRWSRPLQPDYQTVVDFSTIVPFIVALGIHAVIGAIELALALYLLVSGARGLLSAAAGKGARGHRGSAALRGVLGILLLVVLLYVDAMDDAVSALYTAKPTRIYFIDLEGRVTYNPGIGPFGFSPDALEEVIEGYLAGVQAEL